VRFREEVIRSPGGNEKLLEGRPEVLNQASWMSEEVKNILRVSLWISGFLDCGGVEVINYIYAHAVCAYM
jgi:hypothetical protein